MIMSRLLNPCSQLETSCYLAVLHEDVFSLDQEAFDQMSLAVTCEASDQQPASVSDTRPMFVLGVVEHYRYT